MNALPLGVSLVTATDVLHLSAWMDATTRARVLKGLAGLGMPPVDTQWAAGAGDGETFKGARVLPREVRLPLVILGADRAQCSQLYNRLAIMLAPNNTARLRASEPGGAVWETHVVRTAGGDYTWGTGTNGRTAIITEVTLRAGDPYWTATTAQQRTLAAGDSGRGLIPGLAELKLTATQAVGVAGIENTGSAEGRPVWTIEGPTSKFTATSPSGDVLEWDGARDPEGNLAEGDTLTLDTRTGAVTDQNGLNRFGGMSTAPKFWKIPPGESTITVELTGATAASLVRVAWFPRSWVVF